MASCSSPPALARPAGHLTTDVVCDADDLAPHLEAWDALAVARERPYAMPAWMLSWWREIAPARACLRVVLVHDGDTLVGVGPFCAERRRGLWTYRLLGGEFGHGIGLLASSGREAEVAAAVARELARLDPAPAMIAFEAVDAAERWPELIADGWPGTLRPRVRVESVEDALTIELDGGYEAWLARRGRRFRKEVRRTARRLEEEHVTRRVAADEAAVDTLLALHRARWEERGVSQVGEDARPMLHAVARALEGTGRCLVALLEGPDGPVAADLVLRAGEVAACWNGGFDPRWSSFAPGTQSLLLALEEVAASGVVRAELGGGTPAYKRRLADGNRPIAWVSLLPIGRRYPLVSLRLAPADARIAARRALRLLPPEQRARVKKLRDRAAGRSPARKKKIESVSA